MGTSNFCEGLQSGALGSFYAILRGLLGIVVVMFICWFFSENKKKVNWRVVGMALLTQLFLAICIINIGFIATFFEILGKCFVKIQDFVNDGMSFLLGNLMNADTVYQKTNPDWQNQYVFLFRALPTIVFFSAISSILYYFGVIQAVVKVLSRIMKRMFGISGAEGIVSTGAVFLGQAGAPVLAEKYIPSMTKSEVYFIMLTGMANIGAALLPAYASLLAGGDPVAQLNFAKDLLAASIMAVPGSIAVAKVIMPQTEVMIEEATKSSESEKGTLLGAIGDGTTMGIKIIVSIAGMLLIFISLVNLFNYLLSDFVGKYTHLNDLLSRVYGSDVKLTIQVILGWIFAPICWLVGIESVDIVKVGGLLGSKLVVNEFVGFAQLSALRFTPENMKLVEQGILPSAKIFLTERSVRMASYMLCSFANFSSVGICIGAIGSLAPNQKGVLTKYAWKALFGAFWVSCISAAMIGMFCSR
ncbi:MAG TPA: Na+ dependent nucleoside transporter [Porphyromonadaceae bacterium]|nr:Na+ dependent nucleoside transporter [Porphyromonadaceae bacterium]